MSRRALTRGSLAAAVAMMAVAACSTGTSDVDQDAPSASATPTSTPPGAVSRSDFDGTWPLTVDRGRVECEPPSVLLFIDPDGNAWALNGTALTAGYPKINPIWRRTPNQLTPKVYIGDLMDAARELCAN